MQIEKDATATIPFRVFLSNGTAPDTGLSNDSLRGSANGAAQFTIAAKISAVSAGAGQYSIALATSETSTLGNLALWYDQGDFPQHVATLEVVNSNPYSSFSNIAAKTYSGVTFGSAATILAGTYSGVTVGINNIAAGTYSGATLGINNIAAGTYSGVTVGINNIAAGNYSGVTIAGVTRVNSNVTPADGTYSAITIGGVTRVNSNVTVAAADYTSSVTVGVGGFNTGVITTASIAAAALDATVFSTDAEQAFADRQLLRSIAGGADSGRSVGQALYALRNRVDASGSVGTVYEVDDTTSAYTFSTTTAAFPISSVDPA